MAEQFNDMADSVRWQMLVNAATRALREAGYAP